MRKILVALVLCPMVALAQGAGGAGQGQGQGQGQVGQGQGQGRGMGPGPARMEKRMRLVRTLGLAEALDLDTQQALRLGDTLQRFDERRQAAHRQLHDARQVLRNAAGNEKATAAEVDGAIQRIFDARAQLQATDREMLAAIAKDLPAQKRARAALFLGRFGERIERRGMMHGHGGGMGPGAGGPGRMGMGGHGMPGMSRNDGPDEDSSDACPHGGCPMEDDD